jgi:ATP-dependent helicase HrpA
VHLSDLMGPPVLTRVRQAGIADLARYLRGLQRRLDSLPADAARDLVRMDQVHRVEDAYLALSPAKRATPDGRAILADLAELRVSLWAQDLGTARPVSVKRLLDRISVLSRQ